MSAESRRRFGAVVRAEPVDLGLACALIAVETTPDLDIDDTLGQLDRLAEQARPDVLAGGTPRLIAEGLRRALGERAGFAGGPRDYADLRSSLLPQVLRRRHGLPILLSVIWLEVARRLGVPAYGVGLPGHFVVAIGEPAPAVGRELASVQLVDPFAGGRLLSHSDAAERVHDTTGVSLRPEHLQPYPSGEILLRILTNVRVLAAGFPDSIEGAREQMWAAELSLLLPAHPVALRREHGHLLARLGDFPGAAAELSAYAEAVSPLDPSAAQESVIEARMARARLN